MSVELNHEMSKQMLGFAVEEVIRKCVQLIKATRHFVMALQGEHVNIWKLRLTGAR